jgi:hypothetical protein
LPDGQVEGHARRRGPVGRLGLGNEPAYIVNALRNDQAELSKMGAARAGKPGQSAHRKVPCPMLQQHRLGHPGPD